MTLMIFIDCGIVEQLIEVIKPKNKSLSDKAYMLLTWILKFSAQKLPKHYSEKVHALTELFNLASNFQNEGMRLFARDKFSQLVDSIMRPEDSAPIKFSSLAIAKFANTIATRDYTPPDTIRTRIAYHLDDVTFHNLVASSEVFNANPGSWS
jgi:Rapamycin-insensitive companion of mTOR, N-term